MIRRVLGARGARAPWVEGGQEEGNYPDLRDALFAYRV